MEACVKCLSPCSTRRILLSLLRLAFRSSDQEMYSVEVSKLVVAEALLIFKSLLHIVAKTEDQNVHELELLRKCCEQIQLDFDCLGLFLN